MNQKTYIGFDSIKYTSLVISQFNAKRIFLVTGKNSYHHCSAEKHLNRLLAGYEVTQFCDFTSNPKLKELNIGIPLFRSRQSDIIIAAGGGSVIDMAKLISIFAVNNINPIDFITGKTGEIKKSIPIIAIPTTAGSGSEATSFAVLYINKIKYSIYHKYLMPNIAIIDPALTMSLPEYITASTGMDALSQAIESYWSVNSNSKSRYFAKAAISLARQNIIHAVNEPDINTRLSMATAAHLSGKAINITRTTAPHAISYPLTSYFGIPHGHAVSLTVPSMLEYIAGVDDNDLADARGCSHVRQSIAEICRMFGCKSVYDAKKKIEEIIHAIGLQTNLSKLGIRTEENIETIIRNGFNPERVNNNPRRLTKSALREILISIS